MEPQIIIEGVINDIDDQCIIKITKTTDYFNPETNPTVSGALIKLTDDKGQTEIFTEIEPGIYTENSLLGKPNSSYTLEVVSEGKEYSAQANIPNKVAIDSVSYYYNPLSLLFDEGYVLSCHFSDPENIRNYYRYKAYNINDVSEAKNRELIDNDDLFNGNDATWTWESESFQFNDTIVVELYTLDKLAYDYYKTLFSLTGEGALIFGSTPANPETNLNNGALGFFGGFTISRDTIVIQPF